MNLGVLTVPTSWYWHDLQRAALPSDTLVALSFTTLAAQLDPTPTVRTAECHRLDHYDALLVRSMPPGSLEQVVFRMNALHRVQAQGLPVLNPPRALEIAVDKYLASAELQAAGLPIPRTRTSQTWEDAMRDFAELGADVVIKPLFGAEGRGTGDDGNADQRGDEAVLDRGGAGLVLHETGEKGLHGLTPSTGFLARPAAVRPRRLASAAS